ncbi:transglutaminase domain-containing protein [Brachybacterium phenoliresistens]|uniref:Transglutaminase-like domain-containing protein n=1 Tax=Brachybacterium phenoliresistens TaxID=396014 RepID=Z9JWX5_9MICO|nr:transglutaminase family protein [Brachybacterium phenoliresistens]EWS82493.1 hypothetical protein BF93_12595 [Brachybacterium phenoliresistens]
MGIDEVRDAAAAAYVRVQAMPYATDAAHDATGLREQGRGNCVAKTELLREELAVLGVATRRVCWEYELPRLLDVQEQLAFRTDVHSAVEVRTEDGWILVDPTHDPPLGQLGLAVGTWNGSSPTAPAFAPLGPILDPEDPADRAVLDTASARIAREVERTPPEVTSQYREGLNRLFDAVRGARPAAQRGSDAR